MRYKNICKKVKKQVIYIYIIIYIYICIYIYTDEASYILIHEPGEAYT